MERKGLLGQIHEDNRALIFGPPKDTGVTRAVGVSQDIPLGGKVGIHGPPRTKSPASSSEKSKLHQPDFDLNQIPFVDDLSMEPRYIVFPKDLGDTQTIFDHIVHISSNLTPNNEVFPHTKKVLGYVFHEVRFGFYCLQMFKHADGLGLSCQLHEGFAPALTPFWDAVKDELTSVGLIKIDPGCEDIDEDFDDFFFDSDTETTEGDGLFLLDLTIPENKFLNLESDPSLVTEWIEDIQDPNFSQDTLLVLAYNCQLGENLKFLMGTYVQQLFEAVTTSMSKAMDLDLPGIRSACKFLDLVAQNAEVKVTEEHIQNMVAQLARWTMSQGNINAVTRSSEISTLLSQNLLKFYKCGGGSMSVQRDLIETIRQESNYGTVKQNLETFLSVI